MQNLYPVILAGGGGTRLWPLSRPSFPKQFAAIDGKYSLLQHSVQRNNFLDHKPTIIASKEHRFLLKQQLHDINITANIILEPEGRDSLAACVIAALSVQEQGPNAIAMMAPSDHIIKDLQTYKAALAAGYLAAKQGKLVTFGIKPTHPHTGYGYIEYSTGMADINDVFTIKKFHEKPDEVTAKEYISQQNFLWNSGIFLFPAKEFLAEVAAGYPALLKLCQDSLAASDKKYDFCFLEKKSFSKIKKISVDYAIMENSRNSVVVKSNLDWNDLGSWENLWDLSNKDKNNNSITGTGNVTLHDTTNSYVHNMSKQKLVAATNIDNLIIVNDDDYLLVAKKDKSQNIKSLVAEIYASNQIQEHNKTYRPWGYYQIIDSGNHHKTKRLIIYPNKQISLQYHNHRAEHWIVVEGTAQVTLGKEKKTLNANESIYVAQKIVHQIKNIGDSRLKIIEVQTGGYLEEDDIVRLKDK